MTNSTRDLGYWHLWCDHSGTSHLTFRSAPELTSRVVAEGAAPVLVAPLGRTADGDIEIAVVEASTVGEWHASPRAQWGVVLAGTFFLEAMDGNRAELVAGGLFLADDAATQRRDGQHGHRAGTVGDDDVRLLMVPVRREAVPVPSQ